MELSFKFTPEDILKAKNALLEANMAFALKKFPNLPDDCIEKNLLEFDALRTQEDYCQQCKGVEECKYEGSSFQSTLLPNGMIRLDTTICRKLMPIPGTFVKKQKKSTYYVEE